MKRGIGIALVVGIIVALGAFGAVLYWPKAEPENASNIIVSEQESRTFHHLVLDNGLRVMLVSDPAADTAAAAVNVFTGSWSNPEDAQGLAHFLEHMLFLGTEKYPTVDDYQNFIQKNGGTNNAYTSNENTLYYFDIKATELAPALDRFSQFFIAPLFDANYTEREKNAVQSEYAASIQNDGRRTQDALREISSPNHPASQLAVGTLETLNVPNMVERLKRFYNTHYVAQNMALSVYGPQSVEQLETLVREQFSPIRNVSPPETAVTTAQFDAAQLPLLVEVEPRRELHQLQLQFPIGPTAGQWQSSHFGYLGYVMGDEGAGSLLAVLKAKGWANGLSAGAAALTNSNTTFNISISLTPEGDANWSTIVSMVFGQLELIKNEGLQSWIHEESKKLSTLAFEFAEPSAPRSTVISMAERLRHYPAENVLNGPYLVGEFDVSALGTALEKLTPDNLVIVRTSPRVETNARSQYYDTPYRTLTLGGNQVASWRNALPDAQAALPEPNPFIPDDTSVVAPAYVESSLYEHTPKRITIDEGKTVWFEQDDAFNTPKTDIHLLIGSNYPQTNTAARLATILYLQLVNDSLNELRYAASLADASYSISLTDEGVLLRLYGFQDKLPLLLDTLALEIIDHTIDPARFELLKANYLRRLNNSQDDAVTRQVTRRLNEWMVSPSATLNEQIQALTSITIDDLITARETLLRESELTFLIHGNLLEAQASELAERIDQLIPQQGRGEALREVALLPNRDFLNTLRIDHNDSAYLKMYQANDSSLREHALFALLAEVINAPYYNELRTQEQLGYVVFAQPYTLNNLPGAVFYVQSPTTDPALIQLYSDRFMSRFGQTLANMGDSAFLDYKQGLRSRLREPSRNLYELSDRYWRDITQGSLHFNSRERLADEVMKVSIDGFNRFYRARIIGDDARSLTLHQIGRSKMGDYQTHRRDIVGYEPINEENGWGDQVTWGRPTFNNLDAP